MFSQQEREKLMAAFDLYNERFMQTLSNEEELAAVTFSPRFEKRMARLIRLEKRPYYNWVNTLGKRVASVALSLLLVLAVMTCSVQAMREPVVKLITEVFARFTSITVDREDSGKTEFVQAAPAFIPQGFALKEESASSGAYMRVYENADGQTIFYSQMQSKNTQMQVDTEGAVCKNVRINGCAGIVCENKGELQLTFANDAYLYSISISADLGEAVLMQIAESIPNV